MDPLVAFWALTPPSRVLVRDSQLGYFCSQMELTSLEVDRSWLTIHWVRDGMASLTLMVTVLSGVINKLPIADMPLLKFPIRPRPLGHSGKLGFKRNFCLIRTQPLNSRSCFLRHISILIQLKMTNPTSPGPAREMTCICPALLRRWRGPIGY